MINLLLNTRGSFLSFLSSPTLEKTLNKRDRMEVALEKYLFLGVRR